MKSKVNRWIVWLGQDYDITHDRPTLEVIQTNKTQIDKQIKHKLKSLKLLGYKKHMQVQHKLIFAKQSIININIFN